MSHTTSAYHRLILTFDILYQILGCVCQIDPLFGPLLVSQVSRIWRQAAMDSPFIWSNISVRLYTMEQKHDLALLYFERSKKVPITLTVCATRRFEICEKMDLLLQHAYRFRSLHVEAGSGYLVNYLWNDMDMPMPRLEAFDTVISNASRINIKRRMDTIEENVKVIPSINTDGLVCWSSWNPIGLTALTLDTTRLWNKPELDDVYRVLETICHTIQHFEYRGLISCIDNEGNTRTQIVFPELRSLAVFCHDDMVPLLEFMIIPALDSLTLRDFIAYPTSSAIPVAESMDIDELILTFDPDGLFQAVKQWSTITHLEIFGIDDLPSDDLLSQPPEWSNYVKTLDQLSSLVLYGIGAATSIAYAIFMHDSIEKPLLPKLSHFLLAINELSENDHLCNYLITRQRHKLPRLQKLSINSNYARHLRDLNHIDILWDSSDAVFVFADPEVGKYIPIREENLLDKLPSL